MTRISRYALAFVAVLLLAACGGDDGGVDPAAEDTTEPVEQTETEDAGATEDEGATGGTTLATADSDLGTILVDGEGMTLYIFDNDSDGESTCYDACADTWPPLTGEASAEGDVDESLIGTTDRDDGTTQVTYGGMPLYYYAPDSNPGDTSGQSVGDVWWVVGPDGNKIEASAGAVAASDSTEEEDDPYGEGY